MENNMLKEYRRDDYNIAPMRSIEESAVKNLLERYIDKGCIVLYAFSQVDDFVEVIERLKKGLFIYTPVYAEKEELIERYIVVYNKDKHNKETNFEELLSFGELVVQTYNLKSHIIRENSPFPKCKSDWEYYVNPSPLCYSERHVRFLHNEVFVGR